MLEGASLELSRGQTVSLVGVSGSGKSTLISLLSGLLRPDSGRVVFDGQDLTALDDRDRARLRASRIGVVLQSGNLVPFLTAHENVKLRRRSAFGHSTAASASRIIAVRCLRGRVAERFKAPVLKTGVAETPP